MKKIQKITIIMFSVAIALALTALYVWIAITYANKPLDEIPYWILWLLWGNK